MLPGIECLRFLKQRQVLKFKGGSEMTYVIGIDIGGTNFRIGAVDSEGEIHHFKQMPSYFLTEGNVVDKMYCEINSYCDDFNLTEKVTRVAIGLPSIVNKDKSFVHSTPNLAGLNNIDLGNLLRDKLNIPVHVDRDVNFLLYHDIKVLNIDPEQKKTVLGFYFGTGLGNAIYIDGKSYQGSNGAAGEIGHIPAIGKTKICGCGNKGCLETIASGKYLQELAQEINDDKIENIFTKHINHPSVLEFLENLAVSVAIECNILDPEVVVIGGGVVFMNDFPKEYLIKRIQEMLRKPHPYLNLQILFSEHTQQSGVLGGAYYIRENYKFN